MPNRARFMTGPVSPPPTGCPINGLRAGRRASQTLCGCAGQGGLPERPRWQKPPLKPDGPKGRPHELERPRGMRLDREPRTLRTRAIWKEAPGTYQTVVDYGVRNALLWVRDRYDCQHFGGSGRAPGERGDITLADGSKESNIYLRHVEALRDPAISCRHKNLKNKNIPPRPPKPSARPWHEDD